MGWGLKKDKNVRRISRKELKIAIIAIGAVCILSVCGMIAALICFKPAEQPQFVPPAFDTAAVAGTVEETDELKGLGWAKIHQDGMPYAVYLCGGILINEQNQADIWFYNIPENEVWLKLRIMDEQGEILAETGLIKPGEYLQTIEFSRAVADDEPLTVKIMSYEPETYLSAGAVTLQPAVKNR